MTMDVPVDDYELVAREVARRLRANDARGDEALLRNTGAQVIENLLERVVAQQRIIARIKDLEDKTNENGRRLDELDRKAGIKT